MKNIMDKIFPMVTLTELQKYFDVEKEDYLKKELYLLAEQGDVDAQFNLGIMYYNGQGVLQDTNKALNWFHKAAEQGDVDAQFNLGHMYYNGQGVLQDSNQALHWFIRANSAHNIEHKQANIQNENTLKLVT